MAKKVKLRAVYDPVIGRYKTTCPECGRVVVRAKSEAAVHNLAQHMAYEHGVETA